MYVYFNKHNAMSSLVVIILTATLVLFLIKSSACSITVSNTTCCRSQWPHGLRRKFVAARLLRSWVRSPPGAWMFVCCECFVLSGRGLCDQLITRPEESYRLCCVVMCDLEKTSRMRRPWPALGRGATKKILHAIVILLLWYIQRKYLE